MRRNSEFGLNNQSRERQRPVTPFVRLAAIDDSPSRRLKPAAPWVYAYGNNFGLFGVGFAFILSERLRNPRHHKSAGNLL